MGLYRLVVDEVGRTREVDPLGRELWLALLEARDVEQQVDDVARVHATQRAVLRAVEAVDQVTAGGVGVGDVVLLAGATEDLQERNLVRVADLNLVTDATEECLVAQLTRRNIG